MPENNLRQALVPVGATVIPQTRGTAPGLICPVGDRVAYLVPGVPHEMREMVERAVLPDLRHRSGDESVIASRVLRTWGESESGLDERLRPVIDRLEVDGGVTLAFLASGWEGIKVRLTARATSADAAAAVLDPVEAEVRSILGPIVFGRDDDTMESVVIDLLRKRGLTLGLAESVTGGLVAARLTDVAGASDVLRGSIVSYASEVKFDLLDVPVGAVVNEETATAMAVGARRVLGADVGLGLTGVAGPGGAGRDARGDAVHRAGPRRGAHGRDRSAARPAAPDATALRDLRARPVAAAPPVGVRLFVAVWPPPEVVAVLASLDRPVVDGVRWTTQEQWHVTLRFLGSVESAEPAIAALATLAGAPGAVATIDGSAVRLGREVLAFPVEGLSDLAALVADAFAGIGRPPERRPFRGHITLARGRAVRALSKSRCFQRVSFTVPALSLVESHLGRGGAQYEDIASVDIGSAIG